MTLLVYCVCMYMHVEVKGQLEGIGLFCHMGPRMQVQVVRFGGKHTPLPHPTPLHPSRAILPLSPPSHPSHSQLAFWTWFL